MNTQTVATLSKQELYQYCGWSDNGQNPKYQLPKVFEKGGQEITKVFFPKSGSFSSNKYRPYAFRFYENAKRLKSLGITAPEITLLKYCPELDTYLLSYKKLPGYDVLRLIQQGNEKILYEVTAFIGYLHNKGIFFRSLHFSNLLYQANKTFGLIDVSDVRFNKKPLPFYIQYRNLKHTFKHRDDKHFWKKIDINQFLKVYLNVVKPRFFSKIILSFLLKRALNQA